MRTIEEDGTGSVIIDDICIAGLISDENCTKCNSSLVYYEKYDAYFCPNCNEWAEENCKDPDCDFCKDRPEKPL